MAFTRRPQIKPLSPSIATNEASCSKASYKTYENFYDKCIKSKRNFPRIKNIIPEKFVFFTIKKFFCLIIIFNALS